LRVIKDLLVKSAIESGVSQIDPLEYNQCLITEKEQEEKIAVDPVFGKAGLIFNSYGL
jgi:hypothetical protein